jgi:hypothetical protein
MPGVQPFPPIEFEFGLCVQSDTAPDCEFVWSSDPSNNPDGVDHLRTPAPSDLRRDIFELGWEDTEGGGDFDFNDLVAGALVSTSFGRGFVDLEIYEVPGSNFTVGLGNNERGEAVGYFRSSPSGVREGFLRKPSGEFIIIRVPLPLPCPPSLCLSAMAVSLLCRPNQLKWVEWDVPNASPRCWPWRHQPFIKYRWTKVSLGLRRAGRPLSS